MDNIDNDVIIEVPPVQQHECYYIVDRHKERFDFPVHRHSEFELNFVEGCSGALRVVGDSIEELPGCDLVFISGNLPHGWLQHNCTSGHIREITLQFPADIFSDSMLRRSPFAPVSELLANSYNGVAFDPATAVAFRRPLEELAAAPEGDCLGRFLKFITIIHSLGQCGDYRILTRQILSAGDTSEEKTRVTEIIDYVRRHYNENLRQSDLALMAGMTPQAFARFFKKRIGRTVGEFIMETRMAAADYQLFFTDLTVSEVCYSCGFTNLSHFCRTFRNMRGCTPSQFREKFRMSRIKKDHLRH